MNKSALKGFLRALFIAFVCMLSCNIYGQNRIYVDFISDQKGCEPFMVQFTPVLHYQDSLHKPKIGEYEWDFGDGTPISQDKSPVHIFTVPPGKIHISCTVKLIVTTTILDKFDTVKVNWISVTARPNPVIIARPQVTSIANPAIKFQVDSLISTGISFHDSSTSFYWLFGDYNNPDKGGYSTLAAPEYSYRDTGKYHVKVQVKSNGCTGADSLIVIVGPQLRVFIPNIFRPIGKHPPKVSPNYFSPWVNETFQPVVRDFASFEMSVYSDRGELYYHTSDPEIGWNGTLNGINAGDGTYYYIIKVKNLQGNEFTYRGNFVLLR
jgi:large repetitive protein